MASASPTSGNFIPSTTAEWQEFSIPLSIFAGEQSIYVKFEMTSGGGNKCYVDDINIQATTGVEELINDEQIQLYPNPSAGNVTVKLNTDLAVPASIQILDISGRVIIDKTVQLSQNPVNINNENTLIPGTYFVNITAGNKKWVKKLVVLK